MNHSTSPAATDVTPPFPRRSAKRNVSRRRWLLAGGATAAGLTALGTLHEFVGPRNAVFIARHQSYDGALERTIRDGLIACGIGREQLRGKRVLLKPNLVEPTPEIPHMTTHPAMVVAAAAVFRDWGASVTVGEAPGHVRDTEMAVLESGLSDALRTAGVPFADLNYESVGWQRNRGRCSRLKGFYFPQSILAADYIVSMPKLKTHHWVGMTASMKNLYGVLPGIKYGWPKNVLHHSGIPETVVDINATLPETLAIVDGIDCMEGDGPILGSCKRMGLVLVGHNLPAVDATIARIMGLVPERISYLQLAARRLGSIRERRIEHPAETWQSVVSPFKVLDQPHLRALQAPGVGPLVT